MCLFEQGNRLGWFPQAKQTYALHLHGFEILWVLSNSFCEGGLGIRHLILLIEHHSPEVFDTCGFGFLGRQGIQFLQRLREVASLHQILGLAQRCGSILWLTAGGQSQDSHQTEKEKQAHRIPIVAAPSRELSIFIAIQS